MSERVSFDTLLVANRGEIACRILRSARTLGLRTVAVYSEADRAARHVALADAAVAIGPAPAHDSYLSIERVIEACSASGAQAVHPGYGFLSENPAFARACEQAGLVFVGPPAEAIERLGNKRVARHLAERIGVPCLAGYDGDEQSAAALSCEAARLGAPLMIKAAAGGGGRGMRRVDDLSEFDAACEAARREAAAAFGSGELLLERLVHRARHVEVQVLADRYGHCIHKLTVCQPSVLLNHAAIEEGHDCQAATKNKGSRVGEVRRDLPQFVPIDGIKIESTYKGNCPGHAMESTTGSLQGTAYRPHQQASTQEHPNHFGLSCDSHGAAGQVDAPQQPILTYALGSELVGAQGNDAYNGCTNTVKDCLHPGNTAVGFVDDTQSYHHHERRQNKG